MRAPRWLAPLLIVAALGVVSFVAARWFHEHGYLLYYGDAQAHVNIARRIVDSRVHTPLQVGTVWLPLLHLAMLPLVGNDALWSSGLAGTFPSAIAFVLAGLFLFLGVRKLSGNGIVVAAAAALFALNPNLLYLQSTAMTEPLFYALVTLLFWLLVVFLEKPSRWVAALAGLAAFAATWTRYEGWFLLPFVALAMLCAGGKRRWSGTLIFCLIAGMGPLLWLAFNWWYWGNALEFYNGPYSARAIYQRQLAAGMTRYPGDGNWGASAKYFSTAVMLTIGKATSIAALVGALVALKRRWWPLLLLLAPPVFIVWSMHSSATPIFVPGLWPFSSYNTRYGLNALPFLCASAALLLVLLPRRFQMAGAAALVVAAAVPWMVQPRPESWICWKESEVNSRARREWTRLGADYLRPLYRPAPASSPRSATSPGSFSLPASRCMKRCSTLTNCSGFPRTRAPIFSSRKSGPWPCRETLSPLPF